MERPPVWDLVGDTSLVEIRRLNPHRERVRVFAKLEMQNPGGSVKDRPALAMIEDGLARKALSHETTIVDATSGNTGIAYAVLGAAAGFRVRLFMPSNASDERKRLLSALGVHLDLTDPLEGQDGAIESVRDLVAKDPSSYFYPDQYSNPANPRAHERTTGPEIWRDTAGEVTHVVCGLGTTGTAMGLARFFRAKAPGVSVVGVEPAQPFHGLEGLKHLATSLVPRIFDPSATARNVSVETERAYDLTRRLLREEGLFVGPSSGAALAASLEVASTLREGTIVAIFPDGGGRYLSSGVFDAVAGKAARPAHRA